MFLSWMSAILLAMFVSISNIFVSMFVLALLLTLKLFIFLQTICQVQKWFLLVHLVLLKTWLYWHEGLFVLFYALCYSADNVHFTTKLFHFS